MMCEMVQTDARNVEGFDMRKKLMSGFVKDMRVV